MTSTLSLTVYPFPIFDYLFGNDDIEAQPKPCGANANYTLTLHRQIREANDVVPKIIATFATVSEKDECVYDGNETISLLPRGGVGAGSCSVMGMYQPDCW